MVRETHLSTKVIETTFHDLKNTYDHKIIYFHTKNETACTLLGHVELEKYKLLELNPQKHPFDFPKLFELKKLFLIHLEELNLDKQAAYHLLEDIEAGIHTLDPSHNPLYQLEKPISQATEDPTKLVRHHLKLLQAFSQEVSMIYEELSEKLSKIEYSLGIFIQMFENKQAALNQTEKSHLYYTEEVRSISLKLGKS
ncbi:MAG: hypothetical protein KAR79_05940 [Simkaniaceae bacterium]|nr:hypothetical protein [Simkaniaceae bacterium]